MFKVNELTEDIAELHRFLTDAKRERVKQILSIEIRKLETALLDLKVKEGTGDNLVSPREETQKRRHITVKIVDYAWDQSDQFVKFYVTIPGVHAKAPEDISTDFKSKYLEIVIKDLNDKHYNFVVKNLLHPIVPDKSHYKLKKDMIVIFLKKESPNNWSYVTENERLSKEAKTPKVPEGDDPGQGLMSLMKQMYEEGDDDMKRTIAESWTKARENMH